MWAAVAKTALKEEIKNSNNIYIYIYVYLQSLDTAGDFPSSLQNILAALKFTFSLMKKKNHFLIRNELNTKKWSLIL